jgi:hypothetical protein
MRQLKDVVNKFVFYSDDEDARGKYSKEKLTDMMRDPVAASKFQQMPVPRSETIQISGTRMRQFLADDDRASFDRYVPQTLDSDMKDKYWSILKGTYGDIQDSRRRSGVLLKLFEAVKRSKR